MSKPGKLVKLKYKINLTASVFECDFQNQTLQYSNCKCGIFSCGNFGSEVSCYSLCRIHNNVIGPVIHNGTPRQDFEQFKSFQNEIF